MSKLESLEPELKAELEQEKRIAKLEEDSITPAQRKRGRGGSPKQQSTSACKARGKKHRGECWHKDGNNSKGKKRSKKDGFSKTQFQQLKALMASSRGSGSGSASASSAGPGWAKGLGRAEQMLIASEYKRDNGMDSDDEVMSIGAGELKEYKRKAELAAKKLTY